MRFSAVILLLSLLLICAVQSADLNNLPANTWVRVASAPGDGLGRDVPPGRAANWVYEPNIKKFIRYGGYTPTYTNAMYAFDPATLTWSILRNHDESFPTDRPGGGCQWGMGYDSVMKAVIICGGYRNGGWNPAPYQIGDRGVWLYFAERDSFARVGSYLGVNVNYSFDPINRILVASPAASVWGNANKTSEFDVVTKTWTARSTVPCPQNYYSGNFTVAYDGSIGKVLSIRDTATWAYDAAAHVWTKLAAGGPTPARSLSAVAYDKANKVVVLFGGSDGQYYTSQQNDTWIFNSADSTWKKLSCPGIPKLARALLYPIGMDYDPVHGCMLLSDPDLGVWAFRYSPSSAMGTTVVDAESLYICKSLKNPPVSGAKDVLLTFAQGANSRIDNISDNTVMTFTNTGMDGGEIMWDYDWKHGLAVTFGGCGNAASPYWEHYGNNLSMFSPTEEKVYIRRVGETGGANRPATGCTRSTIYDSKRNIWWLFGGTSSGPYCSPESSLSAVSVWTYNVDRDVISPVKKGINIGNMGCVMSYDPDHDITIVPGNGIVNVFRMADSVWEQRTVSNGPGALYVYNRTAYIKSIKKFFCLQSYTTPSNRVLGWTYDPEQNKWDSVAVPPTMVYRSSKLGLAYDTLNDVAIVFGGQTLWNVGPVSDSWAWHAKTNTWEALSPIGGTFSDDCMKAVYDPARNVFYVNNKIYRYKKNPQSSCEMVKSVKAAQMLSAYPNPFNSRVKFSLNVIGANNPVKYSVYDSRGALVYT
ncbi:MAG: hypothetical protein JNL74_02945, partial [Fibrobacteres bacterium]|nr:hypothetical protein [Fibrobacterota bacterium]